MAMVLDDVVRQYQLPLPNYIKLDVDGAELLVLRGATATLAGPDLRSILIEIDQTLSAQAISLLAGFGFSLREKFKRKKKSTVWYGVFQRAG